MDEELIDLHETYKRRTLYLELWKRRAQHNMHHMQSALNAAVPEAQLRKLQRAHNHLQTQYQALLQREAQVRITCVELRQDARLVGSNNYCGNDYCGCLGLCVCAWYMFYVLRRLFRLGLRCVR